MFETPKDMATFAAFYEYSVIGSIIRFLRNLLCSCCLEKTSDSKWKFERAPEPTDVFWENLQIPLFKRVKNILITYLVTLGIIGCCFGLIFGIKLSQK